MLKGREGGLYLYIAIAIVRDSSQSQIHSRDECGGMHKPYTHPLQVVMQAQGLYVISSRYGIAVKSVIMIVVNGEFRV